jgi:hypothetical protein
MTEAKKPAHPLASVSGIVGAIGGWSLSQYCGATIWLPGLAALLLLLVFTKTPVRRKYFGGAIATTGAHLIWFITGSAVAGMWAVTLPDIVLLSIGLVWLWVRPGLASALFLGVVQIASLAVNVVSLSRVTFGDTTHRALTAHCVFRVIAISCLVFGYMKLRRERLDGAAASAMTSTQ